MRHLLLTPALFLFACGTDAPATTDAPAVPTPVAEVEPTPTADPPAPSAPRERAARVAHPTAEPAEIEAAPPVEARPAPARAAAPEIVVERGDVSLTRAVVAPAIADREPVRGAITAGLEQAWLFLEAQNEGDATARIEVTWVEPDGTEGAPIALEVPPAPRWRTWASTRRTHGRAGRWTAVVRVDGEVLSRVGFDVGAAPVPEA